MKAITRLCVTASKIVFKRYPKDKIKENSTRGNFLSFERLSTETFRNAGEIKPHEEVIGIEVSEKGLAYTVVTKA
jgi:hypothetical protein